VEKWFLIRISSLYRTLSDVENFESVVKPWVRWVRVSRRRLLIRFELWSRGLIWLVNKSEFSYDCWVDFYTFANWCILLLLVFDGDKFAVLRQTIAFFIVITVKMNVFLSYSFMVFLWLRNLMMFFCKNKTANIGILLIGHEAQFVNFMLHFTTRISLLNLIENSINCKNSSQHHQSSLSTYVLMFAQGILLVALLPSFNIMMCLITFYT
jgi:hypothetical protein